MSAKRATPAGRGTAPAASERLRLGAAALGVELDGEAIRKLMVYLDELETWNARLNLVGEHDRGQIIDRHLVDALAAVPLLRALGTRLRIADVGSGAGLPGVPLAIACGVREMILIEPRRKRASFLRAVHRALRELPLTVVERRADELREPGGGEVDAVVSRAALPDEELLQVGRALLRAGGLLIAYRGPAPSEPHEPAVRETGFGVARVHPYVLPGRPRSFTLVIRERSGFT